VCDESKTIPIPRVPELSQDMEGIILYNNLLKETAEQEQVSFVDMLDVVGSQDLEDGMHPTAQGHEKMFVRIKDFLEDNKII
jgi:lysophospholipase L1-like esterase